MADGVEAAGTESGKAGDIDSVALPADVHDAMVAHARAGYPNEACGVVIGTAPAAAGGIPLRFVPTRNAAASPYRYEIDKHDLLRVSLEADDRDEAIWGIFHSHTHTPARPSPTDVALAFYPDALYLLVSLDPSEADTSSGAPSLRCWRIAGGEVREVALLSPTPPWAGSDTTGSEIRP